MAYSAVNSLLQTTQRLLKASRSSIAPHFVKTLEFVYEGVLSLQQVLKTLDSSTTNRDKVSDLDKEIRDTVCELEDILEKSVVNDHDVNFVIGMVKKMKEYTNELRNQLPEEQDAVSSSIYDVNSSTEMLTEMMEYTNSELSNKLCEQDDALSSRIDNFGGLSDEFGKIKNLLTDQFHWDIKVVSLFGMAGIGKTTFAKKIFQDPSISRRFGCRAFVTIGQKYQLKEVIRGILAQVDLSNDGMLIEEDEIKMVEYLYKYFKGRRYLVVLDDVWDLQIFDDLIGIFPDHNSGSRVLITTRLEEVAKSCLFWKDLRMIFPNDVIGTVVSQTAKLKGEAQNGLYGFREMLLLSKEESWRLLREKVFGEEYSSCSYKLEKAGKKIAEKCEGLPLTIVTVGEILSKAEKTWEYWNEVAEKQNSVFVDAYDQMYKVLYSSYDYLPQHLKACFLYMGVFSEKHEIIRSKLVNMWIADGVLESVNASYFYASEYVEKLVSSSLVMVRWQSYNGQTKTCSLHSTFWYLCNKEAVKNKFFYALNSLADAFAEEGIESQRRLCIRNNVLFGIKDAYDSMASVSTARSLLCTGPYHQYPVPICFGLMLLRVLDALTIRFYEFPMEVVKLVQLRYFALTYSGNLRAFISRLRNLEYLIIHRHHSIVNLDENLSYLPMEIWDMKELKYLHVMGSNLPNPREESLLLNLVTLLDVCPQSCTKDVLERMPRLKKLGVRIEMDEHFSFFDHISLLDELRSLKCAVVNPVLVPDIVSPHAPLSIFSTSLKKLTMSGFGYSWEEMKTIASLPNLEVLKLRCYAFRGPKWETRKNGFTKLKFLSIEDTDLVRWTVERGSLPLLQVLSIKHCYKLEGIPRVLLSTLRKIELVDCSSLVVSCAKGIKEELLKRRDDLVGVDVHSSWDDVKA